MTTTNPYPHHGALAASRLRAALDGDLREAANVASAMTVDDITKHLGDRAIVRPWGVAICADATRGLAVLGGGVVRAYVGQAWENFKQGAALDGDIAVVRPHWVATPEGQNQSFAFCGDAAGALGATAVLGVMMHIGVDMPTPLGLGGSITGPAGATLTGREAWDAFRRVPQLWRAAAELFGAERVLEAVVGRRDGTGAPAAQVLEALWPDVAICPMDDTGTQWSIGDGLVAQSHLETWRAGQSGGYATVSWSVGGGN